MMVRCFEMSEKILRKIEKRIDEDPNYKPSPSDLIGCFQATAAVQSLTYSIPALQTRLEGFKAEVAALEQRILTALTSSSE